MEPESLNQLDPICGWLRETLVAERALVQQQLEVQHAALMLRVEMYAEERQRTAQETPVKAPTPADDVNECKDDSNNKVTCDDVQNGELRTTCACGNVFMPDAMFCRKCGAKRTQEPTQSNNDTASASFFYDPVSPASQDPNNFFFKGTTPTPMQRTLSVILSHPSFDTLVGMIICANAITIGIESEYTVKGNDLPVWVRVLDYLFLVVYAIEIVMRFLAHRSRALLSHWVKFDLFLVVCGISDAAIKVVADGLKSGFLDKLLLLRVLRLGRLARLVRLFKACRHLWMMVMGLFHSLEVLVWTFIVVFVICYMFAVAGMEIIMTQQNPDDSSLYDVTAREYFGSLSQALMTLLQALTLDSIAGIYRPLITQQPELWVYFVSFILLASIALMNLVTGIMVESAIELTREDQEAHRAFELEKKTQLIKKVRIMFEQMDTDGSGEVDMSEIRSASPECQEMLAEVIDINDMEDFIRTLDADGSGTIGIDEFCDGMIKAQGEKPMELYCVMRQCRQIMAQTAILLQRSNEQTAKEAEILSRGPSQGFVARSAF